MIMLSERWRKLTADEKKLLCAYFKTTHSIAQVLFRIPQGIACLVTVAFVVDIFTKWDEYVVDIPRLLTMTFVSMPMLWLMFFILPMLLVKALNRELTALEKDTACLCDMTVVQKYVSFTGSSANGHPRRTYMLELDAGLSSEKHWKVTTNGVAYEQLSAGDTCSVVYFPSKEDGRAMELFSEAFLCGFPELATLKAGRS